MNSSHTDLIEAKRYSDMLERNNRKLIEQIDFLNAEIVNQSMEIAELKGRLNNLALRRNDCLLSL